ANAFSKRHQFLNALVAVVLLAITEVKVTKVGQSPAARVIHFLYNRSEPLSIRRQASVILDNNADFVLGAEFGQPPQTVGGAFELFRIVTLALRIHTNRMTAKEFCSLDPLVVILHGLLAASFVTISQRSFFVDHDEHISYSQIACSLFHLGQILLV